MQIRVKAYDMAIPAKISSDAEVRVTVGRNSHTPAFSQPEGYETSIKENTPPGGLVLTARATDSDSAVSIYLFTQLTQTLGRGLTLTGLCIE